jgi:hypothetical protein
MITVSSSFTYQIGQPGSEPVRKFYIGLTDYSSRVTKWPKITRSTEEIKSISINMPLANNDGAFNQFYLNSYRLNQTGTVKLGYGTELLTLYTGELYGVRYPDEGTCEFKLRDKFWQFITLKIGDRDTPVSFASQAPSEIAWTLCSCYGGLSNVRSSNNPDIDYDAFTAWSSQFSFDTIRCAAYYDGTKLTEALKNIVNMTDSVVWITGDNKVSFARWEEPSSADILYTRSDMKSLGIDVDRSTIVNRMKVGFTYQHSDDIWANYVTVENSASVSSYGLFEQLIEDDTVWFVDSASAINTAERMIAIRQTPPRQFKVKSGLQVIPCEISDTIRLTNSFYNVTSSDVWRIVGVDYTTETGEVMLKLDAATMEIDGNPFRLDISDLDGDDILY